MRERGYPVEDFDQQRGRRVRRPPARGRALPQGARDPQHERDASTEDLRQAMVHYRALFAELLEPEHEDRWRSSDATTPSTREIADTKSATRRRDADREDARAPRRGPRGAATSTRRAPTRPPTSATTRPSCCRATRTPSSSSRWESIQTGFVDEPRQTVEQADELVAHVMKRLAEGFAAERERLEQQWGRGEDVSTEDLRIALQRYRGLLPAPACRLDG